MVLKIPLNLPKIIQVPSQPQAHDVPFLRAIALLFLSSVTYGSQFPFKGLNPGHDSKSTKKSKPLGPQLIPLKHLV